MSDVRKSGTPQSGKRTPFSVMPQVIVGSTMIALLFGIGGVWAATAMLAGAIISPGYVVVERNVKKVQHLDGGIVAQINIAEGETVKAGQVLMKLDSTLTSSELGVIVSQLIELTGRRARLSAERDGADSPRFPENFDAMGSAATLVRTGEIRLFNENRKGRESQKEQLELRIGQLKEEIEGLNVQIASKTNELRLINQELEQIRSLQQRKLTPISRVYAMEREQTRLNGERGNLMAQVARAQGQISEIRIQIVSLDQNARTEAQRELRAIEARIAELTEKEAAARDRLKRMEILAPQSGIVHELAVHTVGGVVTAAAPIMMIVPANEKRTVEARIAPVDIDQVQVGLEARLRFTAFNQRTTPEIPALVSRVAANISTDPKTGASYYTAHLELDDKQMQELGAVQLVPGMPVEVFISTGQRSAFSYFAKPLTDQFARAFREE